MNDFDMDSALADLLNEERRKEKDLPGLTSLVIEREAITEAFHEHVVSIHAMKDDITPENIFATPSDEEVNEEYGVLEDWIGKDISEHEELLEGVVRVSGEGIFMTYFQDNETDMGFQYSGTEVLSGDETVRGKIACYEVIPIPGEEDSERIAEGRLDELSEDDGVPAVWVILKDVTLYDEDGMEVDAFDRAAVPFTLHNADAFDGLEFHKVTDLADDIYGQRFEEQTGDKLRESLMGNLFMEHCADIENELNNSNYAGEQLIEYIETYVAELHHHVKAIPINQVVLMTGIDAIDIKAGKTVDVMEKKVTYNYPAIIQIDNFWRVVHNFISVEKDDKEPGFLQIQPGSILSLQNPSEI